MKKILVILLTFICLLVSSCNESEDKNKKHDFSVVVDVSSKSLQTIGSENICNTIIELLSKLNVKRKIDRLSVFTANNVSIEREVDFDNVYKKSEARNILKEKCKPKTNSGGIVIDVVLEKVSKEFNSPGFKQSIVIISSLENAKLNTKKIQAIKSSIKNRLVYFLFIKTDKKKMLKHINNTNVSAYSIEQEQISGYDHGLREIFKQL